MALLLALLATLDTGASRPGPSRPSPENPVEGSTVSWKADLRLTVEQIGANWVFVLRGSTTVPRGVRLRARVYAVERVATAAGILREDEEPLLWEEDSDQPAYKKLEGGPGRFRLELGRFARRPFALLYRAMLLYRARDQQPDVTAQVGEEDWAYFTDLRVGSDARLDEEIRLSAEEAGRDFLALDDLFREFHRRFETECRTRDAEGWKDWQQGWLARIDRIDARNLLRYGLWAVWNDRQAKMRIGGLCEQARRIVRHCNELFQTAAPDFDRLQEMIRNWRNYFDDGVGRVGAETPLDPERFRPILRDYERAVAALRTPKAEPPDEEVLREARRECLGALFRMAPLLTNRRRAYPAFNELCRSLTRVVALAGDPAALEEALAAHDAAFQEVRKLVDGR